LLQFLLTSAVASHINACFGHFEKVLRAQIVFLLASRASVQPLFGDFTQKQTPT